MILWIGLAGALIVAELVTGTFYILMAAIGALSGAALSYLGASVPVQMITAAIITVVSMYGVYFYRKRYSKEPKPAENNPDINMDIGQIIVVHEWHDNKARVSFRGAQWDVELVPGAVPGHSGYQIVSVRGSTLIVTNPII